MQLGMYKNKIYIKYNEANVVNSVRAILRYFRQEL